MNNQTRRTIPRKLSILFVVVVICLLIIYIFLGGVGKSVSPKMSHLESYQKMPENKHKPNNKNKEVNVNKSIGSLPVKGRSSNYTPHRSLAHKETRNNPVGAFLTSTLRGYDFNESMFAIRKRDYKGNTQNILGEIQGMFVVKTNDPPSGSLSLIKKENEDRVGLYMGKIVLIHKLDEDFENQISSIIGNQSHVSHVSGVYVIESPGIPESIKLLFELREKFSKSQVDLDINYSRNEAK